MSVVSISSFARPFICVSGELGSDLFLSSLGDLEVLTPELAEQVRGVLVVPRLCEQTRSGSSQAGDIPGKTKGRAESEGITSASRLSWLIARILRKQVKEPSDRADVTGASVSQSLVTSLGQSKVA